MNEWMCNVHQWWTNEHIMNGYCTSNEWMHECAMCINDEQMSI